MATDFPTALDELTNPTGTDPTTNPDHAAQHANINDAVEALQAKVGIDASAVATSHDKLLTLVVRTDQDSTLATGTDLVIASTGAGTKIGTATNQLLAFHGSTPTDQSAAYTQTFSTADRTHAARTATTLTVTDGAGTNNQTIDAITDNASTITAVQALAAAVNALIVDLADTASVVNALVDDLQEKGLVG